MKKQYIEPVTNVVMVKLVGSILEDIDVNAGSLESDPNNSFSKESTFEEDDTFTTPTQPNLWDDEEQ